MAHSPGPWHVHQTRTHFHVRATTHDIALIRRVGPESEYDAALMAEAPALLDLAEQCIAHGPLTGSPIATAARQIVNRARLIP